MLSIAFAVLCLIVFNENFVQCHSRDTTCTESHKLFADLCFSPTPATNLDYNWLVSSQPAEGWYSELGNDMVLLHDTELLKGEILTHVGEDVENSICLKFKTEHVDANSRDGELFGFGNLYFNFTCKSSLDHALVQKCTLDSGLSEYHENADFYVSYSDNKNFYIVISCFATGEVGWHTNSPVSKLSDEDKKVALDHIESLGFPKDTAVNLYNDNCEK